MTLLLLLIALPAAAQASRPAKPVEVRAISQAVVAFVKGDFPKSTHFRIFAVRVSTVDSHYAAARVSPLNKTDQPLTDTAFVALHRVGTHWSVVDLGTDGVGCTRLPAKVEHDLFALFFPECRHH
jgi:hypothetical protein